jgi:hypothetical protein
VTDAGELQRRAKRRQAILARARRDPRYRRVMGRYVAAGLLTTTVAIEPYREPIELADALWAGELEPRILELLPALIVKRPSLFVDVTTLPADLRDVVKALRNHLEPNEFRGVPGAALRRWLPAVGHRGKLPSRLKSFRLQADDLELLAKLTKKLGVSQTTVLRRGLRQLAATQLL